MGQKQVCNGAMLKCSMGMAPSTFMVTPEHKVLTTNQPAANIMDNVPMKNIMPFGMCQSPANPAVAAATAAAMGVLTPQACVPVIPGPWIVGAVTILLDGKPALDDVSKLMCAYAGIIEVTQPGQQTHEIP
jgi:Domain of unknown function (DUF4280)